ncbi:helix-turn-helix domain-containing protein [Anoxybacillus flavithermus]|uniref:LuxR C-terminal-related transcriptional regulator n=1 Tax=Anoxybacillus flavithermus TaxID=33934 RepID=UPI001F50B836|nr:helix-turn-helix transcriptional regulator [Anoxybacillus flavithermus]
MHDICFFYRASLGGPDERREQKFATLVGDHFGMSPTNILLTLQISERLKISKRTVERHLSSIFEKLGVSSRTGAVAEALRLQLIK